MKTKVKIQENPIILKNIDDITIPDLWHIAMALPKPDQDKVLEVWHLCHSLVKHIASS